MTDPLEWARRAATLPAVLVEATPRAVRISGTRIENQARRNLRTASGDLRLSRVRSGKGARVDVRLQIQGSGSGARSLVLPVGPVSLIENDTRAHRIPFVYSGATGASGRRRYATQGEELAGGGRARRKRARPRGGLVYIPGVGVRTHVKHPGTTGKHPMTNAFKEAAPVAGRVGAETFARAIRQHLG